MVVGVFADKLWQVFFTVIGDGAANFSFEHRQHHAELDVDSDFMRMN